MNAVPHHRQSIRLRGYDYTQEGAYFVTVCTVERKRLFGTVYNGRMALNDAGRMAQTVWDELPAHYPGVAIDAFVVMPDHIHGIVRLCSVPAAKGQARGPAPTEPQPMSLPDIMHRFKSLTTKRYADGVVAHGWPRFPGTLWHRNYYDIIIRTERALANIRTYIRDNPSNADVLRFGEPRFSLGSRALLHLPKTAFLASRPYGQAPVPALLTQAPVPALLTQAPVPALLMQAPVPVPVFPTPPACVISGFLSPQERAVFDACLANDTPMIQILARGLPNSFPPRIQRAIDGGRLLIMTPFPNTETRLSAARAAWCNQYVLAIADALVIGHLNPDGMLACLLTDLPHDKPIERA